MVFEAFTSRPPRVRRGLQLALGLPLSALLLSIALLTAHLLWVPHRVHYAIARGVLTVTAGAPPFLNRHVVALDDITLAEAHDLVGGRRVAGTSLPGYCFGTFHYRQLGRVWQATDCGSRTVVLKVRGLDRPMVLSPTDREVFLTAVRERNEYRGGPAPAPPVQGWERLFLVLPLVALAVALMIPVIVVWGPTRLAYRISPDAVEVRRLLRTRRFPIAGCTARRHHPKVGIRLWGTAMPGYYTGLFRADTTATRIYATTLKDGVLIEGDRLRLFLSPEDPDAFLDALRERTGIC